MGSATFNGKSYISVTTNHNVKGSQFTIALWIRMDRDVGDRAVIMVTYPILNQNVLDSVHR